MTPLLAKVVAAIALFLIGLAVRGLYLSHIYPVLSERHEAAKVRLEQGASPSAILTGINLATFVGLPVLGFLAFGPLVRSLVGAL
jgi:hypothetical protein